MVSSFSIPSPMPYTTSPMPLTSFHSSSDPLKKPKLNRATSYRLSQKIESDTLHMQQKNDLDALQAAVAQLNPKTQEKFEQVWIETLGELAGFRAKIAMYNDSFSMKNKETASEWSPAYTERQKKDEEAYQNTIKTSQKLASITADRIKELNTTENRIHFFRLLHKHQLHGNSRRLPSKLFQLPYRYGALYRMTEIEGLLNERKLALQSKDTSTDSSTSLSEESDPESTSSSIFEQLSSLSQQIVILKEEILTYNETLKEFPHPVIAVSSYQDQLETAETLKTTFAKLEESITEELKKFETFIEIQKPLADSVALSNLLAKQAELHSKKKLIETRIGEIFNLLEDRRKQCVLEKADGSDYASLKSTHSSSKELLAELVSLKETLKAEADWEKHFSPTQRKALYHDAVAKYKTLKASIDALIDKDPEYIKKQEQEEDRIKRAVAIFSTFQERFKKEKAELDVEMGKRKTWVLPLSSSSLALDITKQEQTTSSSTTTTLPTTASTTTTTTRSTAKQEDEEEVEDSNSAQLASFFDSLVTGDDSTSKRPQDLALEHKESKLRPKLRGF